MKTREDGTFTVIHYLTAMLEFMFIQPRLCLEENKRGIDNYNINPPWAGNIKQNETTA